MTTEQARGRSRSAERILARHFEDPAVVDALRAALGSEPYGTRRTTLRRLLLSTRQLGRRERKVLEAERDWERRRDAVRSLRELIDAQSELVERTKAAQVESLLDGLEDISSLEDD